MATTAEMADYLTTEINSDGWTIPQAPSTTPLSENGAVVAGVRETNSFTYRTGSRRAVVQCFDDGSTQINCYGPPEEPWEEVEYGLTDPAHIVRYIRDELGGMF